jgi:hypothetical protein
MRTILRWIMRLVFLAVLSVGILLGLVYPWAAEGRGYEIGRWRAYDRVSGFTPVEILLPTDQAQISVKAELSTPQAVSGTDRQSVMTLTVSSNDRTELVHYFSLDGVEPRLVSPQLPGRIYSVDAGLIYRPGEEPYLFTFGPGDAEIDMATVDLVLIGGTSDIDEAVPPIGYAMIGIGFLGLLVTFRRRRENPNSQPPQQRWGRG